jgi:hypothetical protein
MSRTLKREKTRVTPPYAGAIAEILLKRFYVGEAERCGLIQDLLDGNHGSALATLLQKGETGFDCVAGYFEASFKAVAKYATVAECMLVFCSLPPELKKERLLLLTSVLESDRITILSEWYLEQFDKMTLEPAEEKLIKHRLGQQGLARIIRGSSQGAALVSLEGGKKSA